MKNHYRKSLLKLCIPFLMISGGDILGQTALDLAGSGNRVETTANLDVTNGFTVEYDVYMNNLINYNGLVTKGCSNVGAPLDVYVLSDGRMTVFYGNCSITGGGNPAYTFSATTWYHIAHTYDPVAGQGQLYVNGSLITTWSVGAGVGNGSVPITIGNRADGATDADAKFDNVRVWSGVRSAADILAYKGVCLTGTETGLEILYNMEEGSGTILHDLATNNGAQDGNIIGTAAWNAGVNCTQMAAALNFDGSNDYVSVGNILSTSYTKEAWIYINANVGYNNMVSGGDGDGSHALGAPNMTLSGGHNGAWSTVADNTTLNLNQWYHVAITYDSPSQTMSLYKNGVLVSQATGVADYTNGNMVRVGAFNDASNLFDGNMDEVRIWNYAKTQCQIQSTMNCELSGSQTGLMLYYKFNEGIVRANNSIDSVAIDSSGNGNNGTLNNFALTDTISNWVAPGAVTSGISCSSTVYTTISVNSPTICAGTTATLTASGATTYTWNTGDTIASISPSPTVTTNYTVTGVGTNNCTSLTVSTITVNNPTTSTVNISGCNNIIVNAVTYTTSGIYTQTLTNAVGCDSILTINATVNIPSTSTVNVNGCSSVNVNGVTYTTSGTYTQTLTNAVGCDSILTVNVVVNMPSTSTVNVSGCSSVNVNATTYTATGTYTQSLTNAMGCDSILTINATVNVPTTSTVNISGCTGVSLNAVTYTTSGIYTQTLVNATGCDSLLTINAMVNLPTTSTISVSGCSNVSVNSITYTTSGIYTQTLTNAAGCDSMLTVNAIVNVPTTSTINVSGCNSVSVNAITYTASAIYIQTLSNAVGCDSTLAIIATINSLPTLAIIASPPTLCAGNSTTLTASGATSYTWSTTETTTSIISSPNATTNYTVTGTDGNNCTNTDTISIVVNNCTTSIDKLSNINQVLIYPNPNNGTFTIKGINELSELHIINELGQVIKTITLKQANNYEITLSGLEKGVYYLIGDSSLGRTKQLFIVTD